MCMFFSSVELLCIIMNMPCGHTFNYYIPMRDKTIYILYIYKQNMEGFVNFGSYVSLPTLLAYFLGFDIFFLVLKIFFIILVEYTCTCSNTTKHQLTTWYTVGHTHEHVVSMKQCNKQLVQTTTILDLYSICKTYFFGILFVVQGQQNIIYIAHNNSKTH